MQQAISSGKTSEANVAWSDRAAAVRCVFHDVSSRFECDAPVLLLGHHDADGLAAVALLARAFRETQRPYQIRIVGRGENPWSREMSDELRGLEVGGIIAADLGVRASALRPGTTTILIDHHVPTGQADGATVISGYGEEPVPTSSLLSFWCASALTDVEPWLWIAAIGLIGDMADGSGFPEMARARRSFGLSSLREATALVNAARRSARADATPALELLLRRKIRGISCQVGTRRSQHFKLRVRKSKLSSTGRKKSDQSFATGSR